MIRPSAPQTWRYRRFGANLVCLDQGIIEATRRLIVSHRSLCLGTLGISRYSAIRMVLWLVRNNLGSGAGNAVTLPVFGNLAVIVHRGCKVFDLQRCTVTKNFSDCVSDMDAQREIETCRKAAAVAAAPRFIAADSGQRWYTEEYICGTSATESPEALAGDYMAFYAEVEQCLLDMLEVGSVSTVEGKGYIEALSDARLPQRWRDEQHDPDTLEPVCKFWNGLAGWLLANLPDQRLQLVLSHGDYSLVNIVLADGKFRVLDWEGARSGSLLADCLNFAFVEIYYGRARGDVTSQLTAMADRYVAAVRSRRPDLAAALNLPREYALRLYYLERLNLLLQRDRSPHMLDVIRNSIRMFEEFDRKSGFAPLAE